MTKQDKTADSAGMEEKTGKANPAESREKDKPAAAEKPKEYGGPKGPEPTRYGDWENKGIVSDF